MRALQGTAADIIRRAMVRMDAALAKKKLNAQMLLQVHDELVFEVPEDEVEKTLPVVRKVMEDAPLPAISLSRAARGRCPRRRQLGRGALSALARPGPIAGLMACDDRLLRNRTGDLPSAALHGRYCGSSADDSRRSCPRCHGHAAERRSPPGAAVVHDRRRSRDRASMPRSRDLASCDRLIPRQSRPIGACRRARRRDAALAVGAAVRRHPADHRDRAAAVSAHLASPLRQARLHLGRR